MDERTSSDAAGEQRSALAAKLTEMLADAVTHARLPGRLYGLVLAYGLGGLSSYVYPLYEVSRAALLEGGAHPHALWDPSWAAEEALPQGVGEDLPDRDLDIDFEEDPGVSEMFAGYCPWPGDGSDEEFEATYDKIDRLWGEVAAKLTRAGWEDRNVVTEDFVALAYPHDPTDADIRDALERSLGSDRYREFDAHGWVPLE